ncbi:hypothetical protein TTHERM_00105270 (macronuclear) [Tetrahymena thermophila SB210]|uniref:Uncharacterized protein n=1 Tax=Tetrahymena thermophila (strain SB210) TaxID=312017 RepID=Q234H1_TETTS|nr:hypothetical protein TTHERM_00105270 [Tetrahymena thermophila SB210]EAR92032.3 hypothetical protein TTHERM_00105270 [Tetrahymena thermophila SB210]|eukprot:XP_001012277.3 hypothetical protein TTHERM_00105270 [Tetrahymena thermophila SB210]
MRSNSIKEARAVQQSNSNPAFGQTFSPLKGQENIYQPKDEQSFQAYRYQNEDENGDLDPSSTLIIEDLMAGQKEWKAVPEIVKLTLKAVKDVLKSQGKMIKEFEKQISSKASKNELNTGLSLKANVSEVGRQVSALATSVDNKIAFEDVQLILRDYALKSEVAFQISQKTNEDDVKRIVSNSQVDNELNDQIQVLGARLDEFQREYAKSQINNNFQNQVMKDVEFIIGQLDTKANISDVQEALETKANKQSVANALHRKANRTDIDVLIEKKVDVTELQNIMLLLDQKADIKIAQQITELLDNKLDRNEVEDLVVVISEKVKKDQQADVEQDTQVKRAGKNKQNQQKGKKQNHKKSNRDQDDYDDNDEEQGIQHLRNYKGQEGEYDDNDDDELENKYQDLDDESDDGIYKKQNRATKQKNKNKGIQDYYLQQIQDLKKEIENIRVNVSEFNLRSTQFQQEFDKVKEENYSSKQENEHLRDNLQKTKSELLREIKQFKEMLTSQEEQFNTVVERRVEKQIDNIRQQIEELRVESQTHNQDTSTALRAQSSKIFSQYQNQVNNLLEQIESFKISVEELLQKKVDKSEVIELKQSLYEQFESKNDFTEFANRLSNDFLSKLVQVKEDIFQSIHQIELEFKESISMKADFKEYQKTVSSKINLNQAEQLIQKMFAEYEVEVMRQLINNLVSETDAKLNRSDFDENIKSIKDTFDRMQKDILLKANIKDVISIVDTKASIKDVNNSIQEIHNELDIKSSVEDVDKIKNDQMIINKSLCIENIVGRWIWKSGQLKSGNAIPWEVEIVNTLQDNFLWEQNKTSILTVSPGLYQIQLGFFSSNRPTIQLLVNGEPVLVCGNDNYKTISGNVIVKENCKYQESTIVGTSVNEFFTLPPRARISIVYLNGDKGEGFIGLKRL